MNARAPQSAAAPPSPEERVKVEKRHNNNYNINNNNNNNNARKKTAALDMAKRKSYFSQSQKSYKLMLVYTHTRTRAYIRSSFRRLFSTGRRCRIQFLASFDNVMCGGGGGGCWWETGIMLMIYHVLVFEMCIYIIYIYSQSVFDIRIWTMRKMFYCCCWSENEHIFFFVFRLSSNAMNINVARFLMRAFSPLPGHTPRGHIFNIERIQL